jgi:hypothetical protein
MRSRPDTSISGPVSGSKRRTSTRRTDSWSLNALGYHRLDRTGRALSRPAAATVLTIPDHAQGAANGAGGLWIARRALSIGSTPLPAPQRRYEIAPGTEGIAFGNAGRLWAVSEAGSRHIYDYPFLRPFQPFFPLVFALDLSRLE